MSTFFVAFNAVAPLACYILTGIFIKKIRLVDDEFLAKLNRLLFKVFYPVIVFANIYKSDFSHAADGRLIAYMVSFIILMATALCVAVPKIIKDNQTQGAFIQAGFRSNIVLFGIPLTVSVFGEGNAAMMSVTCAFVIPLYNVLAVIVLEHFSGMAGDKKTLFKNIIKNPLILGAIAGIAYNLLKLPTPVFMQNIIKNISDSSTVFALIVLGASLHFSSMASNLKYILSSLALRLFAVPFAAVTLAYMLGFRDMQLFTVLIITATPVATAAYTMAQNMHSNHRLTAQLVALSTVLSVFTIFAWIMAFFTFGLIQSP